MSSFCQHLYHRKCQRRGVGGQKSQNLVNIVCERPLTTLTINLVLHPDSGVTSGSVENINLFKFETEILDKEAMKIHIW